MIDQTGQNERRRAMEAFAAAETAFLADRWRSFDAELTPAPVRGPETGLVMLRGRIGGGGAPFNLGEASVTRASVQLADGTIGHAMVLGRDAGKARLAACFDAAWQIERHRSAIEAQVIVPALAARRERAAVRAAETAATKVDFFTLVRGED